MIGALPVSATGIGTSAEIARARHDAEQAERVVACREVVAAPEGGETGPRVSGWAAGRDDLAAVRSRAILEFIERWQCTLWWQGVLPPLAPPPAARAAARAAAVEWRRCTDRPFGLAQIGGEGHFPVMVAWSRARDGFGLCFGMACDEDAASAARRALQELCQMEFGLEIIRHKHRRAVPLSDREARLLARSMSLGADVIAPLTMPVRTAPETPPVPPARACAALGVTPAIEVFDESWTVIHVHAEGPDLPQGEGPAGPWTLYGEAR